VEWRSVLAIVALVSTGACRQPDLFIESGPPSVDVSVTGVPGGSVRVGPWTVRNGGGRTTGVRVLSSYHLSPDPVITADDRQLKGLAVTTVDSLAAGETHTFPGDPQIAIPDDVTPGTYYFGIILDRPNVVAESDEQNNTAAVRIGIVKPPSSY
jgi:CARDB